MQKNVLSNMIALGLAMGAGAACAQSSITLYGNFDIAVDSVHKGQGYIGDNSYLSTVVPGLVTAAVTATSGATAGAAAGATASARLKAAYANPSTLTRVTQSISSQNSFGVKGVEDIGAGYKGNFVLEGQFASDTGAQSGQDNRMWGRQAYVGLTTPYGEVRAGRQYAPMFYTYALSTVEILGASDLMGFGLVVNSLQNRQDNQISYWLKQGGLTASVAYSPNAGVDKYISSGRNGVAAGTSTGQIIGAINAGTEASNTQGRGQSFGLFANYAVDSSLNVSAGYHTNKFGDASVVDATTGLPLVALDRYQSIALGSKYTVPTTGTVLGVNYLYSKFKNDASSNVDSIQLNVVSFGFKHPIDQFAVGMEGAYAQFTNFTKGKDFALMFSGDYKFSKRTKVYTRFGMLKDLRGQATNLDSTAVTGFGTITPAVTGGPVPILTGFGSTELPFFAGGGANIDATSRVFAIGIRHEF